MRVQNKTTERKQIFAEQKFVDAHSGKNKRTSWIFFCFTFSKSDAVKQKNIVNDPENSEIVSLCEYIKTTELRGAKLLNTIYEGEIYV